MRRHGYQLVSKHLIAVGAGLTRYKSSGEAVSTVVKDGHSLGMYCIVFVQFLPQILTRVIGTAVLAWLTSWRVGITIFVSCLVAMALAGLVSLVVSKPVRAYREADAHLTSTGTDAMSGMRTLRGLGATGVLEDRYRHASNQVEHRERAVGLAESLVSAVALIAAGGLIVAVSGHALFEFGAGRLTIGSVVGLVGLAVALSPALSLTAAATSEFRSSRVAQHRLMSLFELPPIDNTSTVSTTPLDANDELPQTNDQQPITISDFQALRDPVTNLSVSRGTFHVVTGRDMAAMSLCAGRMAAVPFPLRLEYSTTRTLCQPTPLMVHYIRERSPTFLIFRCGTLSCTVTRVRSYSLAPSAVRSTLGGTATDDDVIRAMHIAAVDDVLPLMPDGLGEQVTEQGRSLSGGQQQRICLDRAILRNPDILILLEPASAVDAATSMVIAERLVTARQGRTTVVFSNSPFFHHLADRVFELPVTPDRTETNRG